MSRQLIAPVSFLQEVPMHFRRGWGRQLLSWRPDHPNWESVVLWWEVRRIPFNIIVGLAGVFSLTVTVLLIALYEELAGPQDIDLFLALIGLPLIGGIVFNVCYTAGWICELIVRATSEKYPSSLGSVLLFGGLGLSLGIVLLPTALWVLYDVIAWLSS